MTGHDVGEAEFEARVLERSKTVPVVVDFWAEWCGPCRTLGPVLEREVAALGGKVELAKVDTDAAPRLSQQFQIRGIPAVMAFRDGKVVDSFVGAQPAAMVREFLGRLAPSLEKQVLERARALRAAGDAAAAEQELRIVHGRVKDRALVEPVAVALAEALLDLGRGGDVAAVLAEVEDSAHADALRLLGALPAEAERHGGEAQARAALVRDARDLEARWALGAALVGARRWEEALDAFLDLVSRSRKFKDDGARKAMLALFELLGPDSDLARDYRRRLQIVT